MREYCIQRYMIGPSEGFYKKVIFEVSDPITQERKEFPFIFTSQGWTEGYPNLEEAIQIAAHRLIKHITAHSPAKISDIHKAFEATYADVERVFAFRLYSNKDKLPDHKIDLPYTITIEDKPNKIGFK